jgi:hypothetical protein
MHAYMQRFSAQSEGQRGFTLPRPSSCPEPTSFPQPLLSPLELPEVLYRRDCEHVAAQPTRADHWGWNRGSRAGTDTGKGRPT